MPTHVRGIAFIVGVVALLASSTAAWTRHDITYKGTVVSSNEKTITVRVTVANEKTMKPETMAFDFGRETKFLRGDEVVTAATAGIRKGEKVAVTIDHGGVPDLALEVRLEEKK